MSTPVFDATTLSALANKIQSDFKSGADPRKKAVKSKKDKDPKNETKKSAESASAPSERLQQLNGKKRKRDRNSERNGGVDPPAAGPKVSQKKDLSKHQQVKTGPSSKKPKIELESEKKPENKSYTKKASEGDAILDLRNIVSELGGDDEDLKLIQDAGSESEMEGQEEDGKTSKLKQDLQDMIKSLGLPQAQPADADTSSEEEREAEETHGRGKGEESDIQTDLDENNEEDTDINLDQEIDGENDIDDDREPRLITQVKQALETLPERKRSNPYGLVIDPQSEWHSIPAPAISVSNAGGPQLSSDLLANLHEFAKQVLNEENEKYASSNKNATSANQFYATVMSSGTLSDKISALTLSVQESPIHNVRTLESLVNLAKKRNRGQAMEVLGALKDLLGPGGLLPDDRRLRAFSTQPALKFVNLKDAKGWQPGRALPSPLTKTHLILWAYEDWLKSTYFDILKILEVWLNDEIAYTRGKAVEFVFALLRDKPEQEANLLRLLINKLGDTDKKIASKSSYHILQIETAHPAMKPLVISSLESDLIFRPHQSNHAKYYGIITLNQTILSSKEEGVAKQVLDIYFALFMELLSKPKEDDVESAQKEVSRVNSKGDRQGGGSAPGKKAQKKAVAKLRSAATEDELREKMLSAVLTGVNRAMPYVDKSSDFFDKHLDTLFRVTHSANFNTSVQALILIQQLSGTHQAASSRFYRTLYESLLDPRLLSSSKQALYLNLLYRALRADLSIKRVQAFVKRLLQITALQQPSFACAVIYLVRELEGVFPSLSAFIDQAEADDSDDEEIFRDVPDESNELDGLVAAGQDVNGDGKHKSGYDGRKRDPEYAGADRSCLWELAPLRSHFHPSVSLFAQNLSEHGKMPSKPDLSTNTLIHFLDRFVYRNPKKTAAGLRGHSLMQPLAGSGDTSGLVVTVRDRKATAELPVNSESFRNKKGDSVGVDEVFFHKYFTEVSKKATKSSKKKQDKKKQESDDEASGSEDEDEIWQALVNSRPEIEDGEEDSDGFDDMDDFEEAMQEDDEDAAEFSDAEGEMQIEPAAEEDDGDDDDDDDFGLDDEDDLLGSDDELPDTFAIAGHSDGDGDDQETKEKEATTSTEKKKKKSDRKKMLKNLPMFASVEDYAALLADEDEG